MQADLVISQTKTCCSCNQTYGIDNFYNNKQNKDGKHSYCKPCSREKHRNLPESSKQKTRDRVRRWAKENPKRVLYLDRAKNLKKKYGITLDDYEEILKSQDGKCGICKSPESGNKNNGMFCVDHDHNINEVRGLLCNKCNSAIGLLGDNLESVKAAVKYLEDTNKRVHGELAA